MKHERDITPTTYTKDIYSRLMETRLAWNLSLDEVAHRMGCDPRTVRKYELGVNLPSVEMLTRWADVLGYRLSIWPKERK